MLYPNGKWYEMIATIPNIILAFNFQFNVFPIYFSLQVVKPNNMMKATYFGVIFCGVVNIAIGVMGYLMYGDKLKDSILGSLLSDLSVYKSTNVGMMIVLLFVCLGLLMCSCMSIPVIFLGFKKNLINAIILIKKKKMKKDHQDDILKNTDYVDSDIKEILIEEKMQRNQILNNIEKEESEYYNKGNEQKEETESESSSQSINQQNIETESIKGLRQHDLDENEGKNKIKRKMKRNKKTRKSTFSIVLNKEQQIKLAEEIESKYISSKTKTLIILFSYILLVIMTILIDLLGIVSSFIKI